jgi:acetyltransferase-like isoleucine patch superfamily enzyme
MGKRIGRLLRVLAWSFPHYRVRASLLRMSGYKVGKNAYVGFQVILDGQYPEYIEIGEEASIAPGAIIMAHSRASPLHQRLKIYGKGPERVVIGKGAWIAAGAIVLPGVSIGEGAVVTAGSVVSRDVAPYTVVAGHPARPIKSLKETESAE